MKVLTAHFHPNASLAAFSFSFRLADTVAAAVGHQKNLKRRRKPDQDFLLLNVMKLFSLLTASYQPCSQSLSLSKTDSMEGNTV